MIFLFQVMKTTFLSIFFVLGSLFVGLVLIAVIFQLFAINVKYFNPISKDTKQQAESAANIRGYSNPTVSDHPEMDVQWQLKTVPYNQWGSSTLPWNGMHSRSHSSSSNAGLYGYNVAKYQNPQSYWKNNYYPYYNNNAFYPASYHNNQLNLNSTAPKKHSKKKSSSSHQFNLEEYSGVYGYPHSSQRWAYN